MICTVSEPPSMPSPDTVAVRSPVVEGVGMVADIAFHGGKGENPHAHIMLTTRTLTPAGFGKKQREWNKTEHLVTWRKQWADRANSALARAGRAERIDHRTLVEQRDEALANGDPERAVSLDRDPQIHLGRGRPCIDLQKRLSVFESDHPKGTGS